MTGKESYTYAQAGVSIAAGNALVWPDELPARVAIVDALPPDWFEQLFTAITAPLEEADASGKG